MTDKVYHTMEEFMKEYLPSQKQVWMTPKEFERWNRLKEVDKVNDTD